MKARTYLYSSILCGCFSAFACQVDVSDGGDGDGDGDLPGDGDMGGSAGDGDGDTPGDGDGDTPGDGDGDTPGDGDGDMPGDGDGDGDEPCADGSEGCTCYGNGTCDGGLSCLSDLCVDAGGDGDGDATGGTGGTDDGTGGSDDGTGGSDPGPMPDPDASTQIEGLLAGTPGDVSGAAVTAIVPNIGNDPAGFYVQAEATGPAIFVAVEAEGACGGCGLEVGDLVSFTANTLDLDSNTPPAVASLSNLTVLDSGFDVSTFIQDLTEASDIVTAQSDYWNELVTVTVTVASSTIYGGSGFTVFDVETDAITGNPDLEIRVSDAALESVEVRRGCTVTILGTPLHAYSGRVQLMARNENDLAVDCPPPPPLAINEFNANITGGCDLVEFRATTDFNTLGYKFAQRGSAIFTFPELNLKKNDLIVLHLDAGDLTCNPEEVANETTANGISSSVNYPTAIDLWSTQTGLNAANNVFTVLDGGNNIVDAVFAMGSGTTTAGATNTSADSAAAVEQWTDENGTIPPGGYSNDSFIESAVPGLQQTGSMTEGESIQRSTNLDTNTRMDWNMTTSTWGQLNAGQSQL